MHTHARPALPLTNSALLRAYKETCGAPLAVCITDSLTIKRKGSGGVAALKLVIGAPDAARLAEGAAASAPPPGWLPPSPRSACAGWSLLQGGKTLSVVVSGARKG